MFPVRTPRAAIFYRYSPLARAVPIKNFNCRWLDVIENVFFRVQYPTTSWNRTVLKRSNFQGPDSSIRIETEVRISGDARGADYQIIRKGSVLVVYHPACSQTATSSRPATEVLGSIIEMLLKPFAPPPVLNSCSDDLIPISLRRLELKSTGQGPRNYSPHFYLGAACMKF